MWRYIFVPFNQIWRSSYSFQAKWSQKRTPKMVFLKYFYWDLYADFPIEFPNFAKLIRQFLRFQWWEREKKDTNDRKFESLF
jgi:hypothetical protein